MARFHYLARDRNGGRVTGDAEAADRDAAERWLREVGLDPLEVNAADPAASSAPDANFRSVVVAEAVVDQLSQLANSGAPLAAGLRAAAAESRRRDAAHAMRTMAEDLERGQTLEHVLRQRARGMPAHLQGLLLAAARTGRIGSVLDEFTEQQRMRRDAVASVWQAVGYPLIVLLLAMAVLSVLPVLVVPQFKHMFEEFELRLPAATQLLILASDTVIWIARHAGVWFLAVVVLVWVVLWFGIPGLFGRGAARRALYAAPLIGTLWQWASTADFAQLLAMLLEAGVPLPEALRLTGAGVHDAYFREACGSMSAAAEQSQSLAGLLAAESGIPASLAPFVRQGEKTGNLADALRNAAAMFLDRIRLRAVLLRAVSPPAVFLVVLVMISFAVISLFIPLFSLITGLS